MKTAEERRLYQRAWRAKNSTKVKQKAAEQYIVHREKRLAYAKQYSAETAADPVLVEARRRAQAEYARRKRSREAVLARAQAAMAQLFGDYFAL